MNNKAITYFTNYATEEDIHLHLLICKNNFIPALDVTVNINEYARKIRNNAVTFEAWHNKILIGLIAAYFNNKNIKGYITNVSVHGDYLRKGIASKLMNDCINYGNKIRYKEISLEVNKLNKNAIILYEKFNFRKTGEKEKFLTMTLILN